MNQFVANMVKPQMLQGGLVPQNALIVALQMFCFKLIQPIFNPSEYQH